MTGVSVSRDRIILFTFVDLLIQLIFFGFLLFVLFGEKEKERTALVEITEEAAKRYGAVNFTRLLDAISRLVPIEDLDRVILMFENLGKDKVKAWSDLVRNAKRLNISPEELFRITELYGALPESEKAKLTDIIRRYVNSPKSLQERIYNTILPTCFSGQWVLKISSVPENNFRIELRPELSQQVPDFFHIIQKLDNEIGIGILKGPSTVASNQFENFGSYLNDAFRDCRIRVQESSETDSRRALLTIQRYFRTS